MADALRESGLHLIREYIPDSPVYNPEDEPGQYNLPYVPHSPVYRPPSPDYTPSAMTSVPELDEPEEGGPTQLHTASVHPTSDESGYHPSSRTLWTTTGYAHTCTHKQGHTSRANVRY